MDVTAGIVRRRDLHLSDGAVRKLLDSGELVRLRIGWYAWYYADPDAADACRVGGRPTATTLLGKYGVWLLRDNRLHVRLNTNTPRTRSLANREVCLHYLDSPQAERDELLTALVAMSHCCSREALIIAIDSLFDRKLFRKEELEPLANRHHRLSEAINLARYGSQAGGETLVRLFLVSQHIRFRLQALLEDGGYHDLLVGDRLVIEVDGREHHLGEQFENDRRRDRELLRRGYLVFRISYRMLYRDWPETQQAILDMVRRGDHLWPRVRKLV